jgi:hypothetical protein
VGQWRLTGKGREATRLNAYIPKIFRTGLPLRHRTCLPPRSLGEETFTHDGDFISPRVR